MAKWVCTCVTMMVVLVACDNKRRSAISAQPESGSFTVDALNQTGTLFENKSDEPQIYSFTATGAWSFAPAAGMVGPTGTDTPADARFLLPGAHCFALVAKRTDGHYEYVGSEKSITLQPGEVIYFTMNDLDAGVADNRGELTVKWTRK